MSYWKVEYTQQAEADLRDIYEYIAFYLLEEEIAKQQTNRLMSAIESLDQMVFRFRLYEKEPWLSMGLRILPIDNFLVFYLPKENELRVVIIRILYGGSNIDEHLYNEE